MQARQARTANGGMSQGRAIMGVSMSVRGADANAQTSKSTVRDPVHAACSRAMDVLLTGAAGFIGCAVTERLLARGDRVVGLDAFDPLTGLALKRARALRLAAQPRSAKMLMPFRYSILGQVVKQATPLLALNLSLIYCPGPDAFIAFPVLTYSLSDNRDLNLIAQSFFAPAGKKFKNQGNSVILRLKWGF